jgi:NAD+ kinase
LSRLTSQDPAKSFEKVSVVSRLAVSDIERNLTKSGFRLVARDPDFVVCYGGDGTVLFAERRFPEIPKLVIKKSTMCRKCEYSLHDLKHVLPMVKEGAFKIRKEMKLEATFKNERLVGLNEIQVRAKLPVYALRFSVSVDTKVIGDLIGDGVVFATPFGSTGYYKSTGGKQFSKGIGISFNNLHNRIVRSVVVSEDSEIRVKATRGPALVFADNNERPLAFQDNEAVIVRKSESAANFIFV